MSKSFQTILYIAASIDGYIAKPDGNLDWLTSLPMPENGDYGYKEMLDSCDSIIMGRTTYDELLKMSPDWPYKDFSTYVLSTSKTFLPTTEQTYSINSDLKEFMHELASNRKGNTWLVGGGKVIQLFLVNNLIDRMILTTVPILLGNGIALFPSGNYHSKWSIEKLESFNTGLVNVTYCIIK